MQILRLESLKKAEIAREILKNKIFIYPTDTIYGIGCNALDEDAVQKIRDIKKTDHPFSVIAPSKDWIYKNCYAKRSYIEKLPGPFTFILKMKKRVVAKNVVLGKRSLGVRIPNHLFTKIVQKAGVPFITTSVNETGKKPLIDVKKIPKKIKKKIDYVIDEGVIDNKPSTIIDLTKKVAKIIR